MLELKLPEHVTPAMAQEMRNWIRINGSVRLRRSAEEAFNGVWALYCYERLRIEHPTWYRYVAQRPDVVGDVDNPPGSRPWTPSPYAFEYLDDARADKPAGAAEVILRFYRASKQRRTPAYFAAFTYHPTFGWLIWDKVCERRVADDAGIAVRDDVDDGDDDE